MTVRCRCSRVGQQCLRGKVQFRCTVNDEHCPIKSVHSQIVRKTVRPTVRDRRLSAVPLTDTSNPFGIGKNRHLRSRPAADKSASLLRGQKRRREEEPRALRVRSSHMAHQFCRTFSTSSMTPFQTASKDVPVIKHTAKSHTLARSEDKEE